MGFRISAIQLKQDRKGTFCWNILTALTVSKQGSRETGIKHSTLAALLLLAEHPSKSLPSCKITTLRKPKDKHEKKKYP